MSWYGDLTPARKPVSREDIARALGALRGPPPIPSARTSGVPRPRENLKAPESTVTSRLTGALRNALAGLGVDERYAQHVANRALTFANDLTPVGDVTSAEAAGRDWRQGNYLGALGNGALAALGAVPGVGDAAAGTAKAIIAPLFHGSPHKFDKFALDKIGTGEGAQAYGHGLYFAENPEVAQSYRFVHGRPGAGTAQHWLARQALDEARFLRKTGDEAFRYAREHLHKKALTTTGRHRQDAFDAMNNLEELVQAPPGILYEVSLDANPEDFLDWDAPMDAPLRQRFASTGLPPSAFGPGTDAGVSEKLRAAGIPGLRYLDQGSRGAGGGTRNYVVFDDSIIDILNRR